MLIWGHAAGSQAVQIQPCAHLDGNPEVQLPIPMCISSCSMISLMSHDSDLRRAPQPIEDVHEFDSQMHLYSCMVGMVTIVALMLASGSMRNASEEMMDLPAPCFGKVAIGCASSQPIFYRLQMIQFL